MSGKTELSFAAAIVIAEREPHDSPAARFLAARMLMELLADALTVSSKRSFCSELSWEPHGFPLISFLSH